MSIRKLGTFEPQIDPSAYVDTDAILIGKVKIGPRASVWPLSVLRGDVDRIEIGEGSNVQDNSVLHVDAGTPCIVGKNVTIGHSVVLHGCVIEDGALIGMGAVVLNGAKIGTGAIVGGGAVVKENSVIPPRTLWAGVPAKQIRELSEDQSKTGEHIAKQYQHEYVHDVYKKSR